MYLQSCTVDGTQVESMARAVEMEVRDYVKQSVKALTSQTTVSENFVYQVKKKDASLQVNLFSVSLTTHPIHSDCQQSHHYC